MRGYKLVIYSNDAFKNRSERLKILASGHFDEVFHYREDELRKTEFFEENKHILIQPRGAGYWLWKPYILLETIGKCSPNDKILYIDCGDVFRENINEAMDRCLCNSDLCITRGTCPTKQFTKRDCFVYMDCDTAEYHDSIQIEAGVIVFKPTEYAKRIFSEWLSFCKDERILTDIPNTCGKDNFPEFLDHRHDQSILNLLAIKYGLKISNSIRGSFLGNYNQTD